MSRANWIHEVPSAGFGFTTVDNLSLQKRKFSQNSIIQVGIKTNETELPLLHKFTRVGTVFKNDKGMRLNSAINT